MNPEIERLRAENERLRRLAASQRPELGTLRTLEVALRCHIQSAERELAEIRQLHAAVSGLLPGHDDLPSIEELSGILGGESR